MPYVIPLSIKHRGVLSIGVGREPSCCKPNLEYHRSIASILTEIVASFWISSPTNQDTLILEHQLIPV